MVMEEKERERRRRLDNDINNLDFEDKIDYLQTRVAALKDRMQGNNSMRGAMLKKLSKRSEIIQDYFE